MFFSASSVGAKRVVDANLAQPSMKNRAALPQIRGLSVDPLRCSTLRPRDPDRLAERADVRMCGRGESRPPFSDRRTERHADSLLSPGVPIAGARVLRGAKRASPPLTIGEGFAAESFSHRSPREKTFCTRDAIVAVERFKREEVAGNVKATFCRRRRIR